jgi:uncharacterized spore protein YtfJ
MRGDEGGVDVAAALERARDAMTVKRVFGDPHERDGVTVIPAAAITGGAGGGSGDGEEGRSGAGGGFGIRARPVGAYVIEDGRVRWEPATDPRRLLLGVQALVALLLAVLVLARRRR